MVPDDEPSSTLRYARQLSLEGWGDVGQRRLGAARVLVIGLGGLGAPVVTYLSGAGVGALTLNDFDRVDGSNLPRQFLFKSADIGQDKAERAAHFALARNPATTVRVMSGRLTPAALARHAAEHDLIVSCCDNLGARQTINKASLAARTPLIDAAAVGRAGHVVLFDRRSDHQACLACLFQDEDLAQADCVGQGVFTPLVGIVGSYAAAVALDTLMGTGPADATTMHCFDLVGAHWRTLTIPRRKDCALCTPM